MRGSGNILRIVLNAVVFLLLEAAALVMLSHNGRMQGIWISRGVHAVQAFLWGGAEDIRDYFSLRKQNRELAEENFRLRNTIREYGYLTGVNLQTDSVPEVIGGFRYILADAVKISNNKQHNYLIIDKGSEDGVEERSGIIAPNGVIGIVDAVGKHFSYARSFKNSGMVVSARIGRDGPVGEIMWDGMTPDGAVLREIPHHIPVHQGDTVYTSGYSSIFPPDIPMGITGEASVVNGSTYNIDVRLFADFGSVRYVTVVNNVDNREISVLETGEVGDEE